MKPLSKKAFLLRNESATQKRENKRNKGKEDLQIHRERKKDHSIREKGTAFLLVLLHHEKERSHHTGIQFCARRERPLL
jgi:hypothetical protein